MAFFAHFQPLFFIIIQLFVIYFRIENSTGVEFTSIPLALVHMEVDLNRPGYITYAYGDDIKTSDSSTTFHIAGNTTDSTVSNATFSNIRGFVQVSENRLVDADRGTRVLRAIDQKTRSTFNSCINLIYFAKDMIKDNRNKDQLLVVDYWYGGIKRVDANTGGRCSKQTSRRCFNAQDSIPDPG